MNFNKVITTTQHVLVVVCLLGVISTGYSLRSYQEVVNNKLDSGFSRVTTSSAAQIKSGFDALEKQVTPVTVQATATLKAGQTLLNTANTKMSAVDLDARTKEGTKALADTARSVDNLAKPIQKLLDGVNEAAPYILDCDPSFAGADCLPNRYLELAGEAEKTLKAISNAAPSVADSAKEIASVGPQIVANADGITADVHSMTTDAAKVVKQYTAPPTKMQKLEGFGKIVLYGTIKAIL